MADSTSLIDDSSKLLQDLKTPPLEYGPIPFWWWHGEPLDVNRLKWQLNKIREQGVAGVVVNYQHDNAMHTALGEPKLFSKEWWDLWDEVVLECERLGMSIGFSDYTVAWPDKGLVALDIVKSNPELRGNRMDYLKKDANSESDEVVHLDLPENSQWLSIKATKTGPAGSNEWIDLLTSRSSVESFSWNPEQGKWKIIGVYSQQNGLDPTHPLLGKAIINSFYKKFVERSPERKGKVLNYFFQDEVYFTLEGMPYWSEYLRSQFIKKKGYDIQEEIIALWFDIGDRTPKIKMDYYDVVVSLMEEGYFRPVFEWFEANKMRMGCDQESRGQLIQGVNYYGDYFRTMRWFAAPGADDPGLGKRRNLLKAKVHSSIGHLYNRPRVWLEGYHSSGWGVTPEQLINFTNENFAYGYNLLNLHGLYYTTFGGWWEWAPPDFHFRQPYWAHMNAFNTYVTRLSFLLTQGVRQCDVAIYYPTSAIQAGDHPVLTEQKTEQLAESLYYNEIDFDFIDDESLQNAVISGEDMKVAGGSYKVILLPMTDAVRSDTWKKVKEFHDNGGLVISFGCVPNYNDSNGKNDQQFIQEVQQIFHNYDEDNNTEHNGVYVKQDPSQVKDCINSRIIRDFESSSRSLFVHHRKIDNIHMYMLFNSSKEVSHRVNFRSIGLVERWDAWTGEKEILESTVDSDNRSSITLTIQSNEAQFIFINEDKSPKFTGDEDKNIAIETNDDNLELTGEWTFKYQPLLNNRWGDYRLPASKEVIGVEIKDFKYTSQENVGNDWYQPEFQDHNWQRTTFSYGPKLWVCGPVANEQRSRDFESVLAKQKDIDSLKATYPDVDWTPYSYSEQFGIENDPQHRYWLDGPHGLKQSVPNEFIDLGNVLGNYEGFFEDANVDVENKTCGTVTPPGSVWYLWTTVYCENDMDKYLHLNALTFTSVYPIETEPLPCKVWVNGKVVADQAGSHPVSLQKGYNQIFISLQQSELLVSDYEHLRSFPGRLRLRAYAVFTDSQEDNNKESTLPMLWQTLQGYLPFDLYGGDVSKAKTGYFRLDAPPGLTSFSFRTKGRVSVWVDGRQQNLKSVKNGSNVFKHFVELEELKKYRSLIAIKIEQEPSFYGGSAILEPVKLNCGTGIAHTGDWKEQGLTGFSGAVSYEKVFDLEYSQTKKRVILKIGKALASARVFVNGTEAGTLLAAPWELDISKWVQPGSNKLMIEVTNTLANHYSYGIPSLYVYPGQTESGLFGPVQIITQ